MFGVIGPRWGSTPPDESGLVNEASECRNGHDLISQMTVGGLGGGGMGGGEVMATLDTVEMELFLSVQI